MSIILCGLQNAGKTSVGKALAQHLGYQFVDTDALLLANLPGINHLRRYYHQVGEAHFRKQEHKILLELEPKDQQVIATGGGLPVNPRNHAKLKQLGHIIYLSLSPAVARKRILQEQPDLPAYIQEDFNNFYSKRHALYQSISDYHIDASTRTIDCLVEQITELLANNLNRMV